MQSVIKKELFIPKDKEGLYFELDFEVPAEVYQIGVSYAYERRRRELDGQGNTFETEINIIDLALINGAGEFLGSSGSNRKSIWINEYESSQGYGECEIKPGIWRVIVGAYKIHESGVTVTYEFAFSHKERRLFKGDLHMHTQGSDGNLTVGQIAEKARLNGLDFIFITDHNNYSHNFRLPAVKDLTVMPGAELTLYKGHINLLGVKKPYDGPFYANSLGELKIKLQTARDRGALVSLNHPFDPDCPVKFEKDSLEYDAVEIWNGPFKKSDMACVSWWHEKLKTGSKIAAVGGSDYHRAQYGLDVGFPATCVYADSRAPSDIMAAIKKGRCYVAQTPSAPEAQIECGGGMMGDTVYASAGDEIKIFFRRLRKDDIIKIISDNMEEEIAAEKNYQELTVKRVYAGQLFVRTEVTRKAVPDLPPLMMTVSNPVYFS